MTRTTLAPALLAATLLLGACSGPGDDPADAHQSPVVHTDPENSADAALALTTNDLPSNTCFDGPPPGDLAWFKVQWKAREDLDSFEVDLANAKGVEVVGPAYTLQKVRRGDRIDFSGYAFWHGWRKTLDGRYVAASKAKRVDSLTPDKGQVGLLVFHLRIDEEALTTDGASFDGVKGTFTTADGETGTAEIASKQVFAAGDACR